MVYIGLLLLVAEVPEIYDGTVIVKSVAREAGDRSKISVYSDNPDITFHTILCHLNYQKII